MKPSNINSNIKYKQYKILSKQFSEILTMFHPFNQNLMAVRAKLNELEQWKTRISSRLNNFNMDLMALVNHEIMSQDDSENDDDTSSDNSIKNKKDEGKFLKVNGETDNPANNGVTIGSRRTRSSITNYSEDCMNDLDISKDPRALVPYNCPNRSQVNSRNKQPVIRVDRNKVAVTTVAVRTAKNKNLKHKKMINKRVSLQLGNRSLRKEQASYRTTIEPFDKASYQQLHGVSEDDEDTVEIFEDDTIIEEDIVKKREELYSALQARTNNNNLQLSTTTSINQNSTVNNEIMQIESPSTTEVAATKTAVSNIPSSQSAIGIVVEQIITEPQNTFVPSNVEIASQSPKLAEEFTNGLQLPLRIPSPPEIECIDEISNSKETNATETTINSNSNNQKSDANNALVTYSSNSLPSSSPSSSESSTFSNSQASETTIDDNDCTISFVLPHMKSKRKITMRNPPKNFDVTRTLNVKVTVKKLNLDNIDTDENFSFIKSRNTRERRITNTSAVKRQRQNDDEIFESSVSKKRSVGGVKNLKSGKKDNSKQQSKPPPIKITRSQSRPVRKTNIPEKKLSKPTGGASLNQRVRSNTLPPKVPDGFYRIPKVQKKVNSSNNKAPSSSSSPSSPQKKVVSKSMVNSPMDGSSKKELIQSSPSSNKISHSRPNSTIHMPRLLPQVPLLHIVEDEEKASEEQQQQGDMMEEDENSQNHHQDQTIVQLPSVHISNSSFFCSVCGDSFSTAMELSVHNDLSGHALSSPRKAAVSGMFSSHTGGGDEEEEEGVVFQNEQFLNPPNLLPYEYGTHHEYNNEQMHYSEDIPISFEEEVISQEEEKVDISMLRPIDPNLRVISGFVPDSVEENDKGENELRILPL